MLPEKPRRRIARRDVEHRLADGVVPIGELLARPTVSVDQLLLGMAVRSLVSEFFGLHPRPRPDALRTKTRHRQYGG